MSETNINWFPGHMKKTLDSLMDQVKICDVVLYLLDSRAPLSCLNPEFNKILNNKPVIFILNKVDFVDEIELKEKCKSIFNENQKYVFLDSTRPSSYKVILNKLNDFVLKKLERNKAKNINIPLRLMVIGVPNVGKSTLINNFAGKNKAEAQNKPGVTQANKWVKVDNNIELLDTPGTLWPKFENSLVAKHLAYIGSIKDEVIILTDLVYEFISEISQNYSLNFKYRYNIDVKNKTPIEIYDEICYSRGFIMKNKEIDYERGAKAIIDDFRKGKLGKIILD